MPPERKTFKRVLLAALVLWVQGCQVADARLVLSPMPTTCPRAPASAVRVSLLGDFAPIQVSDDVVPSGAQRSWPLMQARSLTIEGLSPTMVTAIGWSGPLPDPVAGQDLRVSVLYGAPDSLCPVWGLRRPRAFHRAALLDGGRVVVTGGVDPDGAADTLEIYRTDEPDVLRPLPLYEGAAIGHSTTVLGDGTFLVAGGAHPTAGNGADASQAAQIYHPDGTTASGVLLLPGGQRALHGALLLSGPSRGALAGKLWLLGGCRRVAALSSGQPPACDVADVLDSSVIYDPQGGSQPGPRLFQPRYGHEVHVLGDGRVLLVGGMTVTDQGARLVPALEAELIDPLDPQERGILVGRAGAGAGLLPGGGLLWASHNDADPMDAGLLLPGEAALALSPQTPRQGATLTVLPDGAALLAGGRDENGILVPMPELYQAGGFSMLPQQLSAVGHAAVLLPDATVLLLGGVVQDGTPTPLVSRYVHSLRVPDATPPAWPLPTDQAGSWLAPRRPDQVHFDGTTLVVDAASAGPGGRPGELALLAGVTWATGQLRTNVILSGPGAVGAAVVLGLKDDGNYHFVRLSPGKEVALLRVAGAQTLSVAGCLGQVLPASVQDGPLPLLVDLLDGDLSQEVSVRASDTELLHCQVSVPPLSRGAVGLGSLGGPVQFQSLSLSRGHP